MISKFIISLNLEIRDMLLGRPRHTKRYSYLYNKDTSRLQNSICIDNSVNSFGSAIKGSNIKSSCYSIKSGYDENDELNLQVIHLKQQNRELTKIMTGRYTTFLSEIDQIQHILQEKVAISTKLEEENTQLKEEIQKFSNELQNKENLIGELQRDKNALCECLNMRNQMVRRIKQIQVEHHQNQKYNKETQTENQQKDQNIKEIQRKYQEEYKHIIAQAIKKEDQYYNLKNQLYNVKNQIFLMKNQYNAYKITKSIESIKKQ